MNMNMTELALKLTRSLHLRSDERLVSRKVVSSALQLCIERHLEEPL
jgi:hypothetical protein